MAAVRRFATLFPSVFAKNFERYAVKTGSYSILQCANYNKQWMNSHMTEREYHKTSKLHAARLSRKPREKKIKLLKLPALDDVYRQDLYEQQTYDLPEAITTMKRYMELDFARPTSLVRIKLDLHPAPVKKGRQTFCTLLDLPHEFKHANRICVFTEDVDQIKTLLDNGALLAGSEDVIQKLTLTTVECDGYVCTNAYFKNKIVGSKELMNVLKKRKPRRNFGMSDDIIDEFLRFKDETIVSSLNDEYVSEIIVGHIQQSNIELEENILAAMEAVRKFQNPKHPSLIKNAALTCCEESLSFALTIGDDD